MSWTQGTRSPDGLDLGSIRTQVLSQARSGRFGRGLIIVGWLHCGLFGICEYLFLRGDRAALHFLPLWFADVALAFLILRPRLPAGTRDHPHHSGRVAIRVWLTFAILCLTSASLNSITGFQIDWFKISWSILSTFAFATMAWIFHIALLIPAVQMSLTGLLIAAYPDHAYAIFGVSWLMALNGLGIVIERSPAARPSSGSPAVNASSCGSA